MIMEKKVYLKIRQVGNSMGVIIPKDVLVELGYQEGDKLAMILHEKDGSEEKVPQNDLFPPLFPNKEPWEK